MTSVLFVNVFGLGWSLFSLSSSCNKVMNGSMRGSVLMSVCMSGIFSLNCYNLMSDFKCPLVQ